MGFSNNYSEARESTFDTKPEGEYEVIIKEIKEYAYKNSEGESKSRLAVKLLIRNDVDQPCKNGWLFHSYFQRKAPTKQDECTNGFSYGSLMWLSQQAGVPDGKNYESFEEFLNDLIDRCIRVKMELDYKRLYKGTPQETISAIMKTRFLECKHEYKPDPSTAAETYAAKAQDSFSAALPAADLIDDDDLPFI